VVGVDMRRAIALSAFALVCFSVLLALSKMSVAPGVNEFYNGYGHLIAPNMVTLVVFDFRGYDTLGECVILVAGVLTLSMLYGRGRLGGDAHEEDFPVLQGTPVLRAFAPTLLFLAMALGIYVALGGHITPGGGFQGGSIVGAGVLLVLVVFGRGGLNVSHSTLVRLEALGLMAYIFLGLAGLALSGFFLYNVGADFFHLVGPETAAWFSYPDGLNAGILPYLNVSVLIKVSAGLTTAVLILLGAKR
jgi:energy-converting hydrogenase B subunit I